MTNAFLEKQLCLYASRRRTLHLRERSSANDVDVAALKNAAHNSQTARKVLHGMPLTTGFKQEYRYFWGPPEVSLTPAEPALAAALAASWDASSSSSRTAIAAHHKLLSRVPPVCMASAVSRSKLPLANLTPRLSAFARIKQSIPATTTEPAAAEQNKNKNNNEQGGGIH